MYIYKITNKINSKIYIGQTTQKLHTRWGQHKSDAVTRRYHSVLHRAINKYGVENFEIEIIIQCSTLDELNTQEIHYIKLGNTLVPNGYNVAIGGKNNKHTPEILKKMSDAQKGEKSHQFGKPRSKETKEKIAAAQRGNKNHKFGKVVTKVQRHKHSIALIGRPKTQEHKTNIGLANRKRVMCNETHKIYESISEAAKDIAVSPTRISTVLSGVRKHTKGFTFSLITEENMNL